MQINQKPEMLCFEKNIADIIIAKTGNESKITFRLYHDSIVVIEEDYFFDVNGLVYIRDLSSLVRFYFKENTTAQEGYDIHIGGITTFTYTINNTEASGFFTVIQSSLEIKGVSAQQFIRSRFLTRLSSKRTFLNSPEYLSFVMLNEDTPFTINYRIFCRVNGNLEEYSGILLEVQDSLANHRIISFDASLKNVLFKLLNNHSIEVDHVYEYRIWAVNDPRGISFTQFSFFPDYSNYQQKNQFVFKNCFNVPEVFVATGTTKKTSRIEASFSMSLLRMRKVIQEHDILYSCNSGYISEDEYEWLDDLITSYSVVLVKNASVLINLVITESDKSTSDDNTLQSFIFTYRLIQQNQQLFENSSVGIFDFTFDNTFN